MDDALSKLMQRQEAAIVRVESQLVQTAAAMHRQNEYDRQRLKFREEEAQRLESFARFIDRSMVELERRQCIAPLPPLASPSRP